MQALQINHFFENRLYMGPQQGDLKDQVIQNGVEQKGAGVRSYSLPIGWILSLLGYASKLEIDNKIFYVNNKSFIQLVIRTAELANDSSAKNAAVKLNTLYEDHKKSGYNSDKVNKMCDYLVKNLEINEKQANYIKSRVQKEQKGQGPNLKIEIDSLFMGIYNGLIKMAKKN